jgi:hypothetical protein
MSESELPRLPVQARPIEAIRADPAALAELGERIAAWLDPTDPEKMRLVLEGLALTVWARCDEPRATGELPAPPRMLRARRAITLVFVQ